MHDIDRRTFIAGVAAALAGIVACRDQVPANGGEAAPRTPAPNSQPAARDLDPVHPLDARHQQLAADLVHRLYGEPDAAELHLLLQVMRALAASPGRHRVLERAVLTRTGPQPMGSGNAGSGLPELLHAYGRASARYRRMARLPPPNLAATFACAEA